MKRTFEVTTEVTAYTSKEDLPAADRALLNAALEAVDNAYAPYSRFHVGAAIRLADGTVVKGNNQENIAYPSGLCAERVAIFSAAANHPGVAVEAVAVCSKATDFAMNHPVTPCGGCRQALHEYEARQPDGIRLILYGESGEVWVVPSVRSLLPLTFEEDGLRKNDKV